jgi:CelD/BcsL family acetyltransferase involved in cellulose biosynthesis
MSSLLVAPPDSEIDAAIVDPLKGHEWDDLLDGFPDATGFHTSSWAKVLCRTYNHVPFYFKFARAGDVVGLVPLLEVRSPLTGRRGVSLPFTDFCGPLIANPMVAGTVSRKLAQLAADRQWKHVELRGAELALFPSTMPASAFYAHELLLDRSADRLWNGLASSVRRAIRKAGRSRMSVNMLTTRNAVDEFYRLHERTRRRHGLPPQPFGFFVNIYEEVIKAGRGFLIFAVAQSKAIAAAMFFEFNGTAIYKFGASDNATQELRPNNLLIWEAICFLARRGCRLLHFGRTELDNEGLRHFKQGWGATERLVPYSRLPGAGRAMAERAQSRLRLYRAAFRRLPLSINRFAGRLIYPHLD